jgi:mannose-6-phosphate isomerase-like protein (cupin superfamily)
MPGDTLKLTAHETLTIVRSDPEVLEVEAVWGPSGSAPPPHLHPEQDEHFRVLDGELTAKVDGEERTLRAGDTLDVPRGTKHQMWNASAAETRARWETRPAGRTEQWFRAVDRAIEEAGGKSPGALTMLTLIDEYDDTIRLAVGPEKLTRQVTGAIGAIGRKRAKR